MGSLDQYKPNSNKYKEEQALANKEEKKIEKVVTGKVITKKEGFFSKMFRGLISEDAKDDMGKDVYKLSVIYPDGTTATVEATKDAHDAAVAGRICTYARSLCGFQLPLCREQRRKTVSDKILELFHNPAAQFFF